MTLTSIGQERSQDNSFHLYQVRKQANLIYDDQSQEGGYVWREARDEGAHAAPPGVWSSLFHDLGDRHKAVLSTPNKLYIYDLYTFLYECYTSIKV